MTKFFFFFTQKKKKKKKKRDRVQTQIRHHQEEIHKKKNKIKRLHLVLLGQTQSFRKLHDLGLIQLNALLIHGGLKLDQQLAQLLIGHDLHHGKHTGLLTGFHIALGLHHVGDFHHHLQDFGRRLDPLERRAAAKGIIIVVVVVAGRDVVNRVAVESHSGRVSDGYPGQGDASQKSEAAGLAQNSTRKHNVCVCACVSNRNQLVCGGRKKRKKRKKKNYYVRERVTRTICVGSTEIS